MARTTLDKWLSGVMDDPAQEKCSRITVVHMQGMQHIEIDTLKMQEGTQHDPKVLAQRFRGKAESYAQDLPGVQTFNVWVFYGGSNEPGARQPFVVNVQSDHLQGGLSTEPPDATGQIMQRMRHNEALMQQVYRRQQTMDDLSLRRDQFNEQIRGNLMRENMEMFTTLKDCLMQLGSQQHERSMALATFNRSSEERKKWLSFAPLLINQILGKEVFPQSVEDTILIEKIAENVTPEHIAMLSNLPGLTPEILGPLQSRIEKYLRGQREEQERMRALPITSHSGASDISVDGGESEENGENRKLSS